jgi:hypothetical protein
VTGNELQALLDARAIKPVAWAAALGVNQSTIYRLIERGDTPLLSPWSHALAALRNVAKETLRTKLQEARSRAAARTPDELALVAHAHAVPEALDGYLDAYIGEHVGEDPVWLQRLGGEIKALCPSLQPYSNLTLGGYRNSSKTPTTRNLQTMCRTCSPRWW